MKGHSSGCFCTPGSRQVGSCCFLCLLLSPRSSIPATPGARTPLECTTEICLVLAMCEAKPVPQTPPGTLQSGAPGYTKCVTSSFPSKHGVSMWSKGTSAEQILWAWGWHLPFNCKWSKRQSVDKEMELGPASWPLVHPGGVEAPGISA